jgi:hypothetical protein
MAGGGEAFYLQEVVVVGEGRQYKPDGRKLIVTLCSRTMVSEKGLVGIKKRED